MKNNKQTVAAFIGITKNKTSNREKLISGIGGFTGIFLVLIVTNQVIHAQDASLVVASMGASAVLLFAVPHGPLSQPWALVAGQFVSAFIGVSCYLLIPETYLAAASAVGLSVIAMYYLRCVHPPGGATALSAVLSGPSVHALGYQFVVTPVLINTLIILSVAIAYNALFPWRRYPSVLSRRMSVTEDNRPAQTERIGRIQLEKALRKMNQIIDISDDDLEKIYQLASSDISTNLNSHQLKLGHYYSNGKTGADWSIRRIIDESEGPGSDDSIIIYKVVAGKGRPKTGTMRRGEFAHWVKYEVYLNNQSWERVPESNQIE